MRFWVAMAALLSFASVSRAFLSRGSNRRPSALLPRLSLTAAPMSSTALRSSAKQRRFGHRQLPTETVYLFDGTSMLFHAYYSKQSALVGASARVNHDNVDVAAIQGMGAWFARFLRDVRPQYVAAAFDAGKQTFRKDLYPSYKAQRDPLPDVLRQQFPVAPKLLNAMGCPTFAAPGFEADDVLATLTRLCHGKQMNVVIVSTDKDMLQLIRPGVHVMNPRTRELIGEEDVLEKYGVSPPSLIDLGALMGDRVDNVPGAKGVGPKTAAVLLTAFGTIDGIYDAINDLDALLAKGIEPHHKTLRKCKPALLEVKEHMPIFRQLIALRQDIEIPEFEDFNTQALKYCGVTSEGIGFLDSHKMHRIYQILGEPSAPDSSDLPEAAA